MCKGGNPNNFKNENQANMWNNFKEFGTQLSIQYNFVMFWFGAFYIKNNQLRFFSGKIVTSLADIYKIIFWHKIFIC